jgi:hypothetical protein
MSEMKCPHCGFDEYYFKVRFSGQGCLAYRFDTRAADNETLFDTVVIKKAKTAFCANCHKAIPKKLLAQAEAARANDGGI